MAHLDATKTRSDDAESKSIEDQIIEDQIYVTVYKGNKKNVRDLFGGNDLRCGY